MSLSRPIPNIASNAEPARMSAPTWPSGSVPDVIPRGEISSCALLSVLGGCSGLEKKKGIVEVIGSNRLIMFLRIG